MDSTPSRTRFYRPSVNPADGFTLVELMVTVTVTAILLTLAIPSFSNLIASSRAKTTATDFYLAIAKARSEAIKRNQNITVTLTASATDCGGSGTWRLRIENPMTVFCTRKGVTVDGPASVVYQSSGRLQGTSTPNYLITADASLPAYRCVVIGPSGRPFVKASTC